MAERIIDNRLKDKFKMVNVLPGEFRFKGNMYDTRNMNVTTARKLVKEGCPYIEEKGSGRNNKKKSEQEQ